MTPPEFAAVVKEAVFAGVGIATVTVAFLGLSTWRRQLVGNADFDAAKTLARATYKLRDAIAACRSRVILAQEFPGGYFDKTHSTRSAEEEADALAHVYFHRWEPVWGALQQFDAATLEAEALWGEQARSRTDALRECLSQLRASMDSLIDNARSDGRYFGGDRTFAIKIRADVHASPASEDELSKKIRAAITGIEQVVRRHLNRAG